MEPLSQLSGMAPDGGAGGGSGAASAGPAAVPAFVEFAQKMTESLFNYAASFAVTPQQLQQQQLPLSPSSHSGETYVPFSTLRSWYSNFERRLQQNPNFWKS